jgi:hypothetical protein
VWDATAATVASRIKKTQAKMGAVQMPFGKHRGRLLDEIPLSYLRWVLTECNAAEPWLLSAIRAEVAARGERFVPADAVLADLEEALTTAVAEDEALPHDVSGVVADHVLDVFGTVRRRHGIGRETELVVPARREPESRGA